MVYHLQILIFKVNIHDKIAILETKVIDFEYVLFH